MADFAGSVLLLYLGLLWSGSPAECSGCNIGFNRRTRFQPSKMSILAPAQILSPLEGLKSPILLGSQLSERPLACTSGWPASTIAFVCPSTVAGRQIVQSRLARRFHSPVWMAAEIESTVAGMSLKNSLAASSTLRLKEAAKEPAERGLTFASSSADNYVRRAKVIII